MAVTVVKPPSGSGRAFDVWGRHNIRLRQITFDSSYPTGGEALNLDGIVDPANALYFFQQRAPLTSGFTFVYDRTNGKLLVFWGNNDGVSDTPFVEVANAQDLSTLVVDVLIIEV